MRYFLAALLLISGACQAECDGVYGGYFEVDYPPPIYPSTVSGVLSYFNDNGETVTIVFNGETIYVQHPYFKGIHFDNGNCTFSGEYDGDPIFNNNFD